MSDLHSSPANIENRGEKHIIENFEFFAVRIEPFSENTLLEDEDK